MCVVFGPLSPKIHVFVVQTRVHVDRWNYCVNRILRRDDLLCGSLNLPKFLGHVSAIPHGNLIQFFNHLSSFFKSLKRYFVLA